MNIPLEKLRQRLQEPLPGWSAQQLMSPSVDGRYRKVPDEHRKAGVMVILYPHEGEDHVIIIQRADVKGDKHGGQLGFPGGKYEEEDGDMLTCALREVEEEIGLPIDYIDVVGALSPLYVFASNFLVSPFVGYVSEKPKLIPQEEEVGDILHVPFSKLWDTTYKMRKDITVHETILKDVPYYDISGKVLWGATAIMMSELEVLVKELL